MKSRWIVLGGVALTCFFGGGFLLRRGVTRPVVVGPANPLFDAVFSHVAHNAVDSLSESEIYRRAARGLLEEIPDPYSALSLGRERTAFAEEASGFFVPLGAQFDWRDGILTVVAAFPDGPAETAGLETSDQIVEVGGRGILQSTRPEVARLLRGEPGTVLSLKAHRPGVPGLMEFTLTRGGSRAASLPIAVLLDHGIGYLAPALGGDGGAKRAGSQLDSLRRLGAKALLLDLRGNPMGSEDQGVAFADLFLDPGQTILVVRGRSTEQQRFLGRTPQSFRDMPIVVLVDHGTSSGAEIIAGALQDHDRALLVGTQTFGKGAVQSVFPLDGDGDLHLTTARWFTPNGRPIQHLRRPEDDPSGAARADSTRDSVPSFRTDAGRIIKGGGGIAPDLLVSSDSFSAGERVLRHAIGVKLPLYRSALLAVVLATKSDGVARNPGFPITTALREAFLMELEKHGVPVPVKAWADGQSMVDRDLGFGLARALFGRPAEIVRRTSGDRQLEAGIKLLQRATTPASLLALAPRP